MRMICLHRADN